MFDDLRNMYRSMRSNVLHLLTPLRSIRTPSWTTPGCVTTSRHAISPIVSPGRSKLIRVRCTEEHDTFSKLRNIFFFLASSKLSLDKSLYCKRQTCSSRLAFFRNSMGMHLFNHKITVAVSNEDDVERHVLQEPTGQQVLCRVDQRELDAVTNLVKLFPSPAFL